MLSLPTSKAELFLFMTLHSPCVFFSYCTNRQSSHNAHRSTPNLKLSTLWCPSYFPHEVNITCTCCDTNVITIITYCTFYL